MIWQEDRPLWIDIGLVALTVLFGMQIVRVLVPGLFWVLGSRMGWGAMQLGIVGFLVFLTAFLAGPLGRLLGRHNLVIATASGLGLVRLAMQLWWGEPLFNICLAMVGTSLFIIFLPAYLESARLRQDSAVSHLALGLLAGLTLDTALNGTFGTYDIHWQVHLLPVLVTLLLVIVQWLLLVVLAFGSKAGERVSLRTITYGISMSRSLTWLAIGPFLFLQLVVFQNIPRVATLTNWPLPIAFGWTLLAQLAGLAGATLLVIRLRRISWLWALVSGIGLIVVLALPGQQATAPTAALLLIGQVLLSLLITLVLITIAVSVQKTDYSGIAVANGAGVLLFLMSIFAYYAIYDLSLPYTNTILEPIAAFIIAVCVLRSSFALPQKVSAGSRAWAVLLLSLLLLLVPLVQGITWRAPAAVPGEGFPTRIMTYNLHNGFNTNGYLDMEAIAQVIDNSAPDIVALQEVSRGWLVNGRLDMLTWLPRRLNMPGVFGPTTGPYWGNAILSRYQIVDYTLHELPPRDLPLLRGFTAARIDVGNNTRLQVIATHFHAHAVGEQVEGDTDIRQLQSKTVLDFWGGAGLTIVLGDLNGEPNDQEIGLLRQAGLVDAAAMSNGSPAYTHPSDSPEKRIDYIWVSPDLKVSDVHVPVSCASDHLPVVALIDR